MQEILMGRERDRDPVEEKRERLRYWLLKGIFERTKPDSDAPIPGLEVGEALDLSREETFRLIQFLAHREFLHYVAAGPLVRITEKGIRYLTRDARRRRSIRDE